MNTLPTTDETSGAPRGSDTDSAKAGICLIMNASSGKGRDRATPEQVEALLVRHAGNVTLRAMRSGQDIEAEARRAVEDGFGTVVAAGGDGTICGVAAGLLGSDCRLGVLPLGTFNYFARGLGLPEDLDEAAQVIAAGHVRGLTVGTVNDRPFLNNASLGIYPAILRQREHVYRRWGRSQLAAYWSVLRTLIDFRAPLTLKVTVDGEPRRVRTPLAFVANNAYQLELFELDGTECVRAGRFALFVAPDCSRFGLIVYALRLAFHLMAPRRDFELLCGSDIEVEAHGRRRTVARDGERERMTGPFRFRVHRDALRVFVPAGGG